MNIVIVLYWSEHGYRFCPFWSGIGFGLRRNMVVYQCVHCFSSKKESVIREFEEDFKKSFCCAFNLGNDDICFI